MTNAAHIVGVFDATDWYFANGLDRSPSHAVAVRAIRSQYQTLRSSGNLPRVRKTGVVLATDEPTACGVPMTVYVIDREPQIESLEYPSLFLFLVDLAACVQLMSSASTVAKRRCMAAAMLDGIAFNVTSNRTEVSSCAAS